MGSRSQGLDALRGLAILMMVLSGIIPFRVLPDWMYHAQLPPPSHIFDATLAGLTWVDLVFPMFLFAMGAAIPLSLSKKIASGTSRVLIHLGILERGLMLAFFGIFLQHVRPFTLNPSPEAYTWLLALGGFVVLFLLYAAIPSTKPASAETQKTSPGRRLVAILTSRKYLFRILGWTGAVVILNTVTFPDGSGFRITRSDIIIIVLANMAVFGAWVWLLTRENLMLRLGIMAVLAGCILSAGTEGWVKSIWDSSPIPWVFRFYYLKYLFIIIPGTIVGELLLRWNTSVSDWSEVFQREGKQSFRTYSLLSVSLILMIVITVAGLHARYVTETVLLNILLGGGVLWQLRMVEKKRTERVAHYSEILHSMIQWGLFWLALGLCLEPFEGGIKKDVSTFSYYFVTTGITIFILVILMTWMDLAKKAHWFPLLAANGQNPMIAYVGMMNLIYPILGLTGLDVVIQSFTASPWIGFLRAVIYTLILAWIVGVFTRYKIYWKT